MHTSTYVHTQRVRKGSGIVSTLQSTGSAMTVGRENERDASPGALHDGRDGREDRRLILRNGASLKVDRQSARNCM